MSSTRLPLHKTEIAHKTMYDGYVAKCLCGWSSEEMASRQAAHEKALDHHRLEDPLWWPYEDDPDWPVA